MDFLNIWANRSDSLIFLVFQRYTLLVSDDKIHCNKPLDKWQLSVLKLGDVLSDDPCLTKNLGDILPPDTVVNKISQKYMLPLSFNIKYKNP